MRALSLKILMMLKIHLWHSNFYLPFVKTVYISGNFVAIERYSIVEWSDVQEDVAEQIEDFVSKAAS